MDTAVSSNFSYIELFFNAHIGVKIVMLLLLLVSIYSWAIIFKKTISLKRARRQANKFEKLFWSGKTIDDIAMETRKKNRGVLGKIFLSALNEWQQEENQHYSEIVNLEKKMMRSVSLVISRANDNMQSNLSFLASVGSVSPFVGLFGTVWGIMSSFQAIAASQNTNIAVVAPGIAEALFATALGLLAAIPAVLAYNKFNSEIDRLLIRYENFTEEFFNIIMRMQERNQQVEESIKNNSHYAYEKEQVSHKSALSLDKERVEEEKKGDDNSTSSSMKSALGREAKIKLYNQRDEPATEESYNNKHKEDTDSQYVKPKENKKTLPTQRFEEIEKSLSASWKR